MEEFSRKKANRRSGFFNDKSEQSKEGSKIEKVQLKSDKPIPPKANTKPQILTKTLEVKNEDILDLKNALSRDKKQGSFVKKKETTTESK